MAFADPQSVTIGGVTTSLPRVSSGANSGAFANSDGTISLSVSHSYGKRTRRVIRVDQNKISADPFLPTQNTKSNVKVYMVVDSPIAGYSVTEVKDAVVGLATFLTASTNAATLKLLGGES